MDFSHDWVVTMFDSPEMRCECRNRPEGAPPLTKAGLKNVQEMDSAITSWWGVPL
jgi:hypothetical protein